MLTLTLSFLLGSVVGLRSFMGPVLLCWAARLGWLHLADTRFAFLGHPSTLVVVTLLALLELIADKLPRTPARTAPVGLIARIVLGGLCGLVLATAARTNSLVAFTVASIGGVAGAFAGYHARRALGSQFHVPDFAIALAEDAVAIAGGLLIVSHL